MASGSNGSGGGSMKYILYILIAVVAIYLISRLVFQGASLDIAVTGTTQVGNPNPQKEELITEDGKLRIKSGGEFTFTFWLYINNWENKPRNVLSITDEGLTTNDIMSVLLYPNEPVMAIRMYTGSSTATNDYTSSTNRKSLLQGVGSLMGQGSTPQCDLQAIDLQRWINVTVVVHGRVVDIFYDGKLNRSCVLPSMVLAGTKGKQNVRIGEMSGFQGSFGVMSYFAYALTPDRIYSIYLAGPGGPPSFLSYLQDKLGINIAYTAPKTGSSAKA